jgi:uncharacterized RDD family membrane protein YckC
MAEWWQRLAAIGLDLVILAIPSVIIVTLIAGNAVSTRVTGTSSASPRLWEGVGVALVVSLGYFSFLDGGRSGQTVGKMALGIAVRDNDTGVPVGAGRALLRRAFCFGLLFVPLVFIPFILNALSPLWDPRRRAWHDKVGRTCVVSIR